MNTIWMILLSTLAATGCYGSPVSPDPRISKITPVSASSALKTNGVVKMRFDEIVTYADLELRWLEVHDSRCPTGVNCFWAGEVKVILEVTRTMVEGSKPVELQLTLQSRREPVTASVFGYVLELLNVYPYPKDKVTPVRSNYVVEIKISKAAQAR
ncbi:MAG: hypothetical protein DRR42_23435 [Gammaproteobacteria bacterium]|nr:MAG: hypothetical protein DRR42_23435 [Gammaproteobacteria bacterium]